MLGLRNCWACGAWKWLAHTSSIMPQWFGHSVRKYEAVREEKAHIGGSVRCYLYSDDGSSYKLRRVGVKDEDVRSNQIRLCQQPQNHVNTAPGGQRDADDSGLTSLLSLSTRGRTPSPRRWTARRYSSCRPSGSPGRHTVGEQRRDILSASSQKLGVPQTLAPPFRSCHRPHHPAPQREHPATARNVDPRRMRPRTDFLSVCDSNPPRIER